MKMGFLAVMMPIALAQTFEVASIKHSTPGFRGFSIVPSAGGRLATKNMTLKRMLAAAYHVQDFQISGGPKWIDTDPYDIVAKAEGNRNLTEHQLLEMLRLGWRIDFRWRFIGRRNSFRAICWWWEKAARNSRK